MTFLHASLAAAGVATVAIPIIIHLLMHRRRRPVMWGAMRFLLEAYRRQRRRLMLEKWLLLACRCLVLALLGLALGRPLLGNLGGDGAGRTLFLLIDNGLASGLRSDDDGGRSALARHKDSAKAAIAALRDSRSAGGALAEGDRVGIITMAAPADGLVIPPSADLAAISQIIDGIEPADSRTDLPGALQLVADTFARSGQDNTGTFTAAPQRTFVAVLSDFREGSLELTPGGAVTGSAVARLPAGVTLLAARPGEATTAPNVTITGVEPLRSVVVGDPAPGTAADQSGQSDLARVLLRRSGTNLPEAATTISARVVFSGPEARPPQPQSSGAGEAVVRTVVRWTAGMDSAMGVVRIPRPRAGHGEAGSRSASSGVIVVTIDNDPLPADNTWRRPVEFRESLRVGVVGPTRFAATSADKLDPASWVRLALAPLGDAASGGIEVVDLEPAAVDAARLSGLDALVLPRPDLVQDSSWVRIGLFMSAGGVVVVAPPPDATVHLWPDAMAKGLGLPQDWTLPRETRSVVGAKLVAPPPAARPEGSGAEPTSPDLLSLVRGELDELLRPVNLRSALPLDSAGDSGRTLLRLEEGPAILWAGRPGSTGAAATRPDRRAEPGLLVYLGLAFSLDWSDLPAKPLMVPLMQEAIRQGVGQARGSWWSLAGTRPPAPSRTVELREVLDGGDTPGQPAPPRPTVFPLDESGAVTQPLRRAAAYRAVDDRGSTRALVAINPDPRGARIGAQNADSVAAWLNAALTTPAGAPAGKTTSLVWVPDLQSAALSGDQGSAAPTPAESVRRTFAGLFGAGPRGTPFDWPLLAAALLFAIIEVVLARRASHAEVGAGAQPAAGTATSGRAAA